MRSNEPVRKMEFEKFKDDAVIWREREAAVSALSLSTFVAAIGPLAIFLMKTVNKLPLSNGWAYAIYATAPVGLLLTIINWIRTPSDYRHAKPVLRCLVISIAAAVGTFVMAGYFGLMKAASEVPPTP